jgi:uncharacterized repeat protein (TIGR03803 family)
MKLRFITFAALSLAVVLGLPAAQAQTFAVLHNFNGDRDGAYPVGQPVVDSNGNIFGTTQQQGLFGDGTVWELTSDGTFIVLHSFDYSKDGAVVLAGVKLDEKGNMFGTTDEGPSGYYGTVFEITSDGTFSTLYKFGSQKNDPKDIYGGVTLDRSGDLYGMSEYGGSSGNCALGCGTVWKLSNSGSETVLHSFAGSDGEFPYGGNLKLDARGNIYGVASWGGTGYAGTLFEITSGGAFRVLHNFNWRDNDCIPTGSLREYKGNLFGTSQGYADGEGCDRDGAVWQYNIRSKTFKVLHSFSGTDGYWPIGGVGCQKGKKTVCAGNIFGTTFLGGANGYGTVWEIDAKGKFSTQYNFTGTEGETPADRPFVDQKGNLFGTTVNGGSYDDGTLWEIRAAKKTKWR